jgi:uncharacterized protein involved in exopolysaccharide biosynthesis
VIEKKSDKAMLAPRDVIRVVVSLLRRTLRRWPVMVGAFVIGLVAAFAVPKAMPPVYVSETLVLYQEVIQTENLLGAQQYAMESRRQIGMRLREMLLSRTNLEQIIKVHNLYPDTVSGRGMIDAVEEFRAKIDCRVRENETFRIVYQAEDPDVVFEVTKALSDSLVEQNRQYRTEQAQATKQFLEAEQKRMAADLSQKEQKLAEFLADHPEFAQDAATSASAAGASVRAAARTSATVDTGVDALERQARRLRSQLASPDPQPVSAFMGPSLDPKAAEAIASAEAALADARRDLQDKQSKYTQQHPDVVEAQNKVRAALARLNQAKAAARPASAPAVEAPASTPEERREALKVQLGRVEAAIANAKRGQTPTVEDNTGESSRVVTLETQWASLNRELNEAREQHEQIQTRLFRATMVATVEASGQASQMVIVDEAYKPKRPSRRGAKRTGAVAAFIVLMLGVTAAFGLALLDDRVYEERDLKKLELGPILHVVPRTPRKGKAHG